MMPERAREEMLKAEQLMLQGGYRQSSINAAMEDLWLRAKAAALEVVKGHRHSRDCESFEGHLTGCAEAIAREIEEEL